MENINSVIQLSRTNNNFVKPKKKIEPIKKKEKVKKTKSKKNVRTLWVRRKKKS